MYFVCTLNIDVFKVRDVRTTDDTMLTVKLMVFYELSDVIKMVRFLIS